jgi:hypothetical protein
MVLALVPAVIALVVAFGLRLAPDQIGATLAVTAVVLGLITRSQVSRREGGLPAGNAADHADAPAGRCPDGLCGLGRVRP